MVSFTGNSATNGGAISAYHSSVVVVSVTFEHNAALHNGGGIFAVCAPGCEENVVVSQASFSHNVARRAAGSFWLVYPFGFPIPCSTAIVPPNQARRYMRTVLQ
jgi:predicted outer membrane repeat protein